MINLSEIIRQQPETSFLRKLRSLRDPDIYLAENIRDYRENASNLEFPWYKREGIFYHAFKPVSGEDREEIRQAVQCAFQMLDKSPG